MSSSLRIIVTGLIAQHPLMGGLAWHYLQYLLGLRQLGHDVYYLEDSGEWPYKTDGGPSGDHWAAENCAFNVACLAQVMERFDLDSRWAYYCALESKWFGLSDSHRKQILDSADLLLNVSGTLEWREEYRRVRRLAFIDSDPVFTQVKLALGKESCTTQTMVCEDEVARQVLKDAKTLCHRIAKYDINFSFGEDFSARVPETGLRWYPTRQPIAISEWEPSVPSRNVFTTIMNWTSYEPIRYQGRTYGQKDVELKRFLDLPLRTPTVSLEVALSQIKRHVQWETGAEEQFELPENLRKNGIYSPAHVLANMGWHIVDSMDVCRDIDNYRSYIKTSMAEWSVAKNGYVVGQPGWFSERSACYLASGRPVVVQDTGFAPVIPVGEGVVTFKNVEEAIAGVQDVQANYTRHCQAARAIAETYFDSNKVLSRLLDEAMRP
jgi:hypothetical protein